MPRSPTGTRRWPRLKLRRRGWRAIPLQGAGAREREDTRAALFAQGRTARVLAPRDVRRQIAWDPSRANTGP
eukprot:1365412-Pyramimonas_sp.AAC.1